MFRRALLSTWLLPDQVQRERYLDVQVFGRFRSFEITCHSPMNSEAHKKLGTSSAVILNIIKKSHSNRPLVPIVTKTSKDLLCPGFA